MKNIISFALFLAVLMAFGMGVFAQGGPLPLTIRTQPFLTGLSLPVLIRSAKDGTGRLFVVQQRGLIRVVQPGTNVATTFIDLTSKVSSSGNERGLLGLTFHPQFSSNSYFFVNYTRLSDGATVVARYTAINGNTQGDLNSERILLTIPQPFTNHNGGMIEFGPDGHLYIGMGDGGSANDPGARAQNINELLGKFLRITPDVSGNNANPPYTNPPDNPFAGSTPGADEIYAVGMRNPWRWSFDRGGTNQLWAADVGQNAIEEVDLITLGGNYGWRVYEGTQCTGNDPGLCTPGNYIMPVFQYARTSPRCSVTGGYVYRGTLGTFPAGAYVYSDYCSGEILTWFNSQQSMLLDTSRLASSFGEDDNGELYLVGLGSSTSPTGTVDKIVRAKASSDFDGDFKTDVSVYRPSTGVWYIANSLNGSYRIQQFGLAEDIPTAEDFDGDNVTDIAVFRPSTGVWYFFRSSDNTVGIVPFGSTGDIPVAGDFDGDAKADLTVFRPSTSVWYSLRSTSGQANIQQFGQNAASGDIPVSADYDGDGKVDIGIFRPPTGGWFWMRSSMGGAISGVQFGTNGDIAAPADYDGDGMADPAVFRPSTGVWYIFRSTDRGATITSWGLNGDIPVPGDYDGDGKDDIGVFRPSTGVWYIVRSSNSTNLITQFGLNGDLPIPFYERP